MDDVIRNTGPVGALSQSLESKLEAILINERSRAFSVAWRLVGGDVDCAEDVLQEAMLKAFVNVGSLRDETRMVSWFFKIVVTQAHSQTRRRRIGRKIVRLFGFGQSRYQKECESDPGLTKRIGKALDELSKGQREAFVLVHLSGFKISEAAAILEKAEGTVKAQLHRATKRLQKALRDIPRE